jgi:4-amino-4-deoxy-L-arabinose transferase-like glycosyltransferase
MDKSVSFDKYPELAKNIIKEGWIGTNVFGDNPFYIYFHAVLLFLFGEYASQIAQIIQFSMGALSCVLTYFIARKLFNNRVGVIASIIQALYGMLIIYEGSLLPATFIIFFNSMAILWLLKFNSGLKPINLFIASAFLGLSISSRPNILLFVFFCTFWLLVKFRKSVKKSLFYSLFFLCSVALFILPIFIRNYFVGKDIVPVTASAGIIFYSSNNPEALGYLYVPPEEVLSMIDKQITGQLKNTDITVEHKVYRDMVISALGKELKPSQISQYWFKKGIQFIKNHPLQYLSLELRKIFFSVNSYEICDTTDAYINYVSMSKMPLFNFGIILSLGLLGIAASVKHWKNLALLYFAIATYFLTLLIFFVSSRMRLPMVGCLIVFSAYSIIYGCNLLKNRKYIKLLSFIGLFFALIFASSYENAILKKLSKHQLAYNIYFIKGIGFYKLGDYGKAKDFFKKALEIRPDLYPRIERIIGNIEE